MNNAEQRTAPAALDEIAGHPFLRDLKPEHLSALAECAMRVQYAPGDVIFREGDPANRFYLLIDGKVSVETQYEGGRAVVQTLGRGDVLGWSWLFPPYYTHFDACVVEPTNAMFFYGTRLREMCEENPSFGYEIIKRVAKVVIERLTAAQKRAIAHPPG